MADPHAPPALPAGPGADAQATVTFLTGVAADGSLSAMNGNATFGEPQHKWGGAAAGSGGGTVSYGFADGAAFTPAARSFIAAGLALWSDIANITFVPSGSGTPQIVFSTNTANTSQTTAQTTGAAGGSTLARTVAGLTTIDTSTPGWTNLDSFSVTGGYGPHSVLHEIGHELGLSHAGDYNDGIEPSQQYNSTDSEQWSIMSYFDPAVDSGAPVGKDASQYAVTGTKWGISQDGYAQVPQTWMPLDILAAQRLYGVAVNTPLSGGQVFGFHCNVQGATRQFFDFTENATPILTLWDKGGGNTLDLSGFAAAATVNLNPGTFSSADGLVNNIGIAYGTAIDGAVGGGSDDVFIANAGNDSIDGGGGSNSVDFQLAGQVYFVSGGNTVSWSGHSDSLAHVGTLGFEGGASTVVATGSGGVQLAGGGNVAFLTGAAMQLGLGGGDTVVAQRGVDTIAAAAGRNLIFGDSGSQIQYVGSAAADTIVATAATIAGGAAGVAAFGANHGALQYAGGSAPATVIGGDAAVSILGGAGGGLFGGGSAGGNSFASGAGAMTVFGGGAGDRVTLANAAANVVVAGPGAEQVQAVGATGGNALYAGSGNDTLAGGLGNDTLFAGTGNATLSGGGGEDYFGFINGHAGGQVVISDWNNATDVLALSGYGAAAAALAATQQQQVGGGTVVRLADNTRITFAGVGNVVTTHFV